MRSTPGARRYLIDTVNKLLHIDLSRVSDFAVRASFAPSLPVDVSLRELLWRGLKQKHHECGVSPSTTRFCAARLVTCLGIHARIQRDCSCKALSERTRSLLSGTASWGAPERSSRPF